MHTGNSGTVAEVFLSQAGPRFELELSHSEHHLHSGSECRTGKLSGAVEQRKRATRSDRPRLAWYGARSLARMPPSEDGGVRRAQLRIEAGGARQDRGDPGRFGEERLTM